MKRTFLFSTALFLLIGCGPEESSQDLYNDQIASIVSTEKAQLAPLAGRYVGLLTKSTGGTELVEVDLAVISVLTPNPSQDQNSQVPTLGGSFNICTATAAPEDPSPSPSPANGGAIKQKSSKGKSQKDASPQQANSCSQLNPITQFTGSTYDAQTKSISLYSSSSSSGSSTGLTGFQVTLNGTIDGGHLTGTLGTSLILDVGTVDLTREN